MTDERLSEKLKELDNKNNRAISFIKAAKDIGEVLDKLKGETTRIEIAVWGEPFGLDGSSRRADCRLGAGAAEELIPILERIENGIKEELVNIVGED